MSRFELYKLAVEQFREQPRTYWTRATFFVTLQGGLISFVAYQIRTGQLVTFVEVAIAFLGLAISLVWLGTTLASRKLIATWRNVVLDLERDGYHLCEPERAPQPGSFQMSGARGEGTTMGLSITRMMTVLSFFFVASWVAVTVFAVLRFADLSAAPECLRSLLQFPAGSGPSD